jgi:hypothetical protein
MWLIAGSSALGPGKIVAVFARDAPQHPLSDAAPSLPQGRWLAVSVAPAWTGATRAEVLRRRIAGMGRPAAYLKDGARDLHTARGLVAAQGRARPASDALSHAVAQRLKRRSPAPPQCAPVVSAGGRVSGTLTHTMRACRAPPTVPTHARLMPGHRLVPGAARWRPLAPAGGAKAGATLQK